MHYRIFAIVDDLSEQAVADAMEPHQHDHWDWWVIGGRYDGYWEPEDVAKARETHRGFNFDDVNRQLDHNHVRTRDLPEDRRACCAFVEGGDWTPRERWVDGAPPKWEGASGAFVEDPEFSSKLSAALSRHLDGYVVVVDAHS